MKCWSNSGWKRWMICKVFTAPAVSGGNTSVDLKFFGSIWPNYFCALLMIRRVRGRRVSGRHDPVFFACRDWHYYRSRYRGPSVLPCWGHGGHLKLCKFCPWQWVHAILYLKPVSSTQNCFSSSELPFPVLRFLCIDHLNLDKLRTNRSAV